MATLNDLVTPAEYAETSRHYPTASSVLWVIRCHKPRLVQAGAVVKVRGRTRVNRPVFEAELAQIVTEEQAHARALS